MNNETNMEMINEVAETGMEIVNDVAKVAKGNGGLKRFGVGAALVVVGAIAYKGVELAIDFGKSKFEQRKQKKNEKKQSETSEEKTESNEN